MRIMLKSKIHRARITTLNIDYEGSITIDRTLMEEADILPFEQVQVVNINNGARFATYTICGEHGSGEIGLNGAAPDWRPRETPLLSFPTATWRMKRRVI